MTPIHFGTKRRFWLSRAVGGLFMAGVAAMMAREGNGTAVGRVGIIGVIFFGAATVVGIVQGARRGPRLTIDTDGIHDRTLGVGVIEWADITRAEPYGVARQPFVGLQLRDPSKYLARATGLKRFLARLNRSSGLSPFSVNLVGLDAEPWYVVKLIMTRCPPNQGPERGAG
jgi:hypothetical protein